MSGGQRTAPGPVEALTGHAKPVHGYWGGPHRYTIPVDVTPVADKSPYQNDCSCRSSCL